MGGEVAYGEVGKKDFNLPLQAALLPPPPHHYSMQLMLHHATGCSGVGLGCQLPLVRKYKL